MSNVSDAIAQLQDCKTRLDAIGANQAAAEADLSAALTLLQTMPPCLVDCMRLVVPQPGKMVRWTTAMPPLADGRVTVYFPKQSNPEGGYPYDIKIMDASGLREHSTEDDKIAWTDPRAASACKSYDARIIFMPRVYDPSQGEIVVSDLTDLPWRRWEACSVVGSSHLGAALVKFAGPFTDKNWGGDIGQWPYFRSHYFYKGDKVHGFTVRESFYWADPFGWFGWEAADGSSLTDVWVTRPNASIHNTIISTNLVPYDPCGYGQKVFF